jgi:predicted outer membrane repeat protein
MHAGGALYSEVNVAVEVKECSCDSNTAVRFAGALFLSDGGSIAASSINRNSATSGGAIYSQVSSLSIVLHSTHTYVLASSTRCKQSAASSLADNSCSELLYALSQVCSHCVLHAQHATHTGGSNVR